MRDDHQPHQALVAQNVGVIIGLIGHSMPEEVCWIAVFGPALTIGLDYREPSIHQDLKTISISCNNNYTK